VHASTVKTVEAQMAHLDTQLQSLDDIVSQIREQNNTHHAAHTTSLSALSSTVQASYSSIGEHLSSSFDRVQSLELDMSEQNATLKDTLPSLAADADIRAPLYELREIVGSQNLIEYNSTGETPQRVSYQIPSSLPRTEAHENLLSRLRDRPATSDAISRSPSKQPIYNDATDTIASPTDMFKLVSTTKPSFSRSVSANTYNHAHTLSSIPLGQPTSLRELDVNVVGQESLTQPLPLVSQSSDKLVMAMPPSKKMRVNDAGDDGSRLPMKKMRKTVAGIADRENMSITNFANSMGPGVAGGRKLRSHGSQ
jgi:kinesin family protein 11